MSNETRVLNYYNEWAGKGVNPDNGTSVHQTTYGMYLQRAPNQWIVRWHDKDDPEGRRWDIMAFMLGLTQPPLTTNEEKSESYWKSYAQQMRKELTDTQRELADLKEAYNGLCEAHAEAAGKLAGASTFDLNVETGKMYAVFGLSRDRGLEIYNACAEVVLSDLRLFKFSKYIQRVWDLAGCSSEAERLYANFMYGKMAFGHASTPMNAAQIETYRLEFKEYGNKTSAAEYDDTHDYQNN